MSSSFKSGSKPKYQERSESPTNVGYGLFVIIPGTGDLFPRDAATEIKTSYNTMNIIKNDIY